MAVLINFRVGLGINSLATLAEIRSRQPREGKCSQGLSKPAPQARKKEIFFVSYQGKSPIVENAMKIALLALKATKNAKRHSPNFTDIWTPKTSRFGVFATIWSHCVRVNFGETFFSQRHTVHP